jgi:hypothetical protein
MVSHTARYPARHGIPRGTVSHAARYPTRHGIPRGTVSHAARYPTRHGIPCWTVSHAGRYPTRHGTPESYTLYPSPIEAQQCAGGRSHCPAQRRSQMRTWVPMMRTRVRTSVPLHNSRRARLQHVYSPQNSACNVTQHAAT